MPTLISLPLDFSRRAPITELMEQLTDYTEYRTCIRGLNIVDRCVLAHRPTFAFLNRVIAVRPTAPLHILDVGSGDGDLLRRVRRWAAARNLPVLLTGIDLNPLATRAALESTPPDSPNPITFLTADALTWQPPAPVDIILSSHLTHHLPDPAVVDFLRWMDATAARAWFVSDIHRHPAAFHLFNLLGRTLRWRYIVHEDGLRSIRRSFTPADWRTLCDDAALPRNSRSIRWHLPFRLCVSRIK